MVINSKFLRTPRRIGGKRPITRKEYTRLTRETPGGEEQELSPAEVANLQRRGRFRGIKFVWGKQVAGYVGGMIKEKFTPEAAYRVDKDRRIQSPGQAISNIAFNIRSPDAISRATASVKGKVVPIGLVMAAMLLSMTPLLSWIPNLQFFFIALLIFMLLPEKSKIYDDARKRAEGFLDINISEDVYADAYAAGMSDTDINSIIHSAVHDLKMTGDHVKDELKRRIKEKEREQAREGRGQRRGQQGRRGRKMGKWEEENKYELEQLPDEG